MLGNASVNTRLPTTEMQMGFLGPRAGREAPVIEEVGTSDQQYTQLKQRYPQQQQPTQQQQQQYPSVQQYQQQPSAPYPQQQHALAYQQQQQSAQPPAMREVTTCFVRVDPSNAAKQKNSAGGYLHVTALQVCTSLVHKKRPGFLQGRANVLPISGCPH
jgi:hypothetical protein